MSRTKKLRCRTWYCVLPRKHKELCRDRNGGLLLIQSGSKPLRAVAIPRHEIGETV